MDENLPTNLCQSKQWTPVLPLVWEDSTQHRATKPVSHTTESVSLEPVLRAKRSQQKEGMCCNQEQSLHPH